MLASWKQIFTLYRRHRQQHIRTCTSYSDCLYFSICACCQPLYLSCMLPAAGASCCCCCCWYRRWQLWSYSHRARMQIRPLQQRYVLAHPYMVNWGTHLLATIFKKRQKKTTNVIKWCSWIEIEQKIYQRVDFLWSFQIVCEKVERTSTSGK